MAWNDHTKKIAVKAIGTVESGLKYDSINYSDPITVGIGQWFGTRAAAILNRMRNENSGSWTGVATSLTNALNTYRESSNYWPGRYLTRAEGESLRPVLNANAKIQNTQIVSDLEDYRNTAGQYGLNADSNTSTFILWSSAYHQSPRRGLRVLADVGGGASVERLLGALLNEPVLGRYRTRYNTVYNIIKADDDSGIDLGDGIVNPTTPTPGGDGGEGGVAGGIGGGLNDTSNRNLRSQIAYIEPYGNNVRVQFRDGGSMVAYATPQGRFVSGKDTSTGANVPPIEDNDSTVEPPTVPGNDSLAQKRAAVVKWMSDRQGKFFYTNDPRRNNPDVTGGGDCSSTIRRAYIDALGIDIGSRSIDQQNSPKRKIIGKGNGLSGFPTNLLLPGDVISMALTGTGRASHVEMFAHMDGSTPKCWGHGGVPNMGPNLHTLTANWLVGAAYPWQINRFIY